MALRFQTSAPDLFIENEYDEDFDNKICKDFVMMIQIPVVMMVLK